MMFLGHKVHVHVFERACVASALGLGTLVMFLSSLVVHAQDRTRSTNDQDIHELERLESVWNQAHERGDADTLEELWADDLEIIVPRMQVMTKTDASKFARSGRMKFLLYRTSDIRARVYREAAVVTGRLQRIRTMNGQQISDDWRFTKMYIRESNKWRVVAFHASEAESQ